MKRMTKYVVGFLLVVGMLVSLGEIGISRAEADSTIYYDIDSDNESQIQEFIDAVDFVAREYGTGDITVATDWLDYGTYAKSNSRGILVNKDWTTGLEDINADVQSDIDQGFHNPGCTAVTTIAIHEAAHVLDARSGFEARDELRAVGYVSDLSGYSYNADGSVNIAEALAEAFQAHTCGTANANEEVLYTMLAYW